MELSNGKVIKDILTRHGFSFSKKLGQNFLINPSVCPRMAEEGGASPETGVLEIGPGIGVLTAELAKRAKKVVAVELDPRLPAVLKETLAAYSNIKIVPGDILKIDLPALLKEEFPHMEVVVCANLPYYITSPVIMGLLEQRLPIKSLTVMVQKEAAKRICAAPGTRDAGAISIAVHYYCKPRLLFHVSRGSFMPAPNVDSSVIRLDFLSRPPVSPKSEKRFFQVVKAAFAQRRKTFLNSASSSLGVEKKQIADALESLGVSPQVRGEELDMKQLAAISDML